MPHEQRDTGNRLVAVALIRSGGHWAVAKRRSHDALDGLWEFPGGRIEPGENARSAAVRETAEETALAVRAIAELPPVTYDYRETIVEIHPVICQMRDKPHPAAGIRWVSLEELRALPMPPANAAIVEALAAWAASDEHA